ncbi:MAG: dihydroorotate dehydrogenase [Candidatus Margulisbacteria bacterium]|nr:dihydroorotate dehydrogenase [Candidatus Margulisiibacteriota bacterium]
MTNLKVKLGKLELQNPIITASGTFGYGEEFEDFLNIDKLGAITLKSITLKPKAGNLPPRIAETPSGMMNSIGLENKGLESLINVTLPKLKKYKKVKVIANIAGHTIEENVECARQLNNQSRVNALEVNISCPNVDNGGLAFCFNLADVRVLVEKIRNVYLKPLIVKLSASVPDILKLAETCVNAGADILSLINTVPALEVDVEKKALFFKRGSAGLSGPAIRPIALKAVYDVAQKFDVPIIGMGGISCLEDVLKFLIVGADAVSIGMMNFVKPTISQDLVMELEKYLKEKKMKLWEMRLNSSPGPFS